jgi:hypothetical protein
MESNRTDVYDEQPDSGQSTTLSVLAHVSFEWTGVQSGIRLDLDMDHRIRDYDRGTDPAANCSMPGSFRREC